MLDRFGSLSEGAASSGWVHFLVFWSAYLTVRFGKRSYNCAHLVLVKIFLNLPSSFLN